MDAIERIIRGAYELGALGATDIAMPFYEARGWQRWTGQAAAMTPSGVVPTPDAAGWLYVLPVSARLEPAAALTCDWRDGDVW